MKMKMIHAKASMVVTVKARGVLLGVAAGVLGALAVRGDIDDPVAYWSFDDAEGLLVNQVTASPHHNASVLFGTPGAGVAEGASGIVGNALVLDGTAAIRLPYHQDNLGTSFTLSLWYWQQTNDTRQCVYQTRDIAAATYEAEENAHDRFASYAGNVRINAVITGLREWIHMVHTFETEGGTTKLSLYTNGVFAFSGNVSSNAMFHANQVRGFHVGAARSEVALGGWGWRCFKGMIDELALWGRALSAAEVEAVYQRGVSGAKLAVHAGAGAGDLTGREGSFLHAEHRQRTARWHVQQRLAESRRARSRLFLHGSRHGRDPVRLRARYGGACVGAFPRRDRGREMAGTADGGDAASAAGRLHVGDLDPHDAP